MRTATDPQSTAPTSVGECDTMLVEARAALRQARLECRWRDDLANRAAVEAAGVATDWLLDCRAELVRQ